ncbi:uncharacterized protein LOC131958020 [Physella acuta]|uniref:uncharacterized protein LOC131958020 n=1 Tax=Physella acuta TaxID=109671 RepID=UPI0027DE0283|nr:uncharacterized protein LOC131958020 [Physella acuta]
MFRSKRKDSAIRTLVAETLVLAKTHGYVEKIEHELEEELQRENTEPPNRILAKWRRNGEKVLKNKYTLLTVALFCVTECALILGELFLDLQKVKDIAISTWRNTESRDPHMRQAVITWYNIHALIGRNVNIGAA